MRLAADVQLRVVAVRLDEIDISNLQQHHPIRRFDHQSRQILIFLCRPFSFALALFEQGKQSLTQLVDLARRNLRLCAFQCSCETLVVEGLQQVVEGVNVESLQSILIERRDKDDCLNLLRSHVCKHVEPIHLRHLNVEKDQVRRKVLNRFNCLTAITTLFEYFDLRISLEQHTKIAPRERFVIDNQCSDLRRHSILIGVLLCATSVSSVSRWLMNCSESAQRSQVNWDTHPAY